MTDSANEGELFAPVGKQRLFESVLDQLEQLIYDGKLQAGDRLPSERALSESLQVSRPSLREALRVLDALDIITVRTGIGASGGTRISDHLGPTISRLMRLYMALGHFDLEDVLHTRHLLEEEAARVAATERTDEQLARLEALLDQMDAAVSDSDTYLALDGKFHVAVALASGNPLLAHLMGSMRDAVTEHLVKRELAPATWPKLASSAQKSHRALVKALRDRDADAAAEQVRRHTAFYDEAAS
ncbi:FadR/GntR family transcriptional regulator [Amycolatopsis dendrobii]|uniref:FadR family transcriptional regulator n=1 Tax=Amycolatopsis dendrobii TaxID=2760662 RepID=A0A7W3W162_9PSEU|nr:FadR/GntR family transcriptional regulator [Amycolatopsis dendrobii]MBB1156951.1 FadR family transcriptional regulator [Amycolatopsis dendrobii]